MPKIFFVQCCKKKIHLILHYKIYIGRVLVIFLCAITGAERITAQNHAAFLWQEQSIRVSNMIRKVRFTSDAIGKHRILLVKFGYLLKIKQNFCHRLLSLLPIFLVLNRFSPTEAGKCRQLPTSAATPNITQNFVK